MSIEDEKKQLPKMNLTPFFFESILIRNGGTLPNEPAAHAAWYFCRTAIQALESYDRGAVYEGELDHKNMLKNIAHSISFLYGLDSPADMDPFIAACQILAWRRKLKWDPRITEAHAQKFYTGGIL